ncbi:MAG: IS1595 family transposase [Terriglobales bacterium]
MTASELINLCSLIDDDKCYQLIRQHRWPDGVCCPLCASPAVNRDGRDETQRHRQRYHCKACGGRFDDLSGTILAGHHQPLRVWVLCLYFMGLNLSNLQIARELDLNDDDVQAMTSCLREGLVARAPTVQLEGVIEIDEVYVVAGHKGNQAATQKKAGRAGGGDYAERVAAVRWRRKNRPSSD